MRTILVFLLAFGIISCRAQSVCDQLSALKQKTYGFKPFGMSDKQMEKKSAELDKFWELAKKNKAEAAPCIKAMLLAEQNDSYFCFDASSLLLSLSEEPQYVDAVVAGLEKSDLKDLQLEPYLRICFYLGGKGKDISNLALKLISYPKARIPLVQHAITLNAVDASLFLYNVMGTQKAESALIKAIDSGNPTAKANAAMVLNLISTARGDSAVNVAVKQKILPDSVSAFIEKDKQAFKIPANCSGSISRAEVLQQLKSATTISASQEIMCSAYKNLLPGDEETVREARQKSMPGLSDEGLGRYFTLTRILISLRSK